MRKSQSQTKPNQPYKPRAEYQSPRNATTAPSACGASVSMLETSEAAPNRPLSARGVPALAPLVPRRVDRLLRRAGHPTPPRRATQVQRSQPSRHIHAPHPTFPRPTRPTPAPTLPSTPPTVACATSPRCAVRPRPPYPITADHPALPSPRPLPPPPNPPDP